MIKLWSAVAQDCVILIVLTNRFHVAVGLFRNRSQIMSKCGENQKVAGEPLGKCGTDVLITFWHLL